MKAFLYRTLLMTVFPLVSSALLLCVGEFVLHWDRFFGICCSLWMAFASRMHAENSLDDYIRDAESPGGSGHRTALKVLLLYSVVATLPAMMWIASRMYFTNATPEAHLWVAAILTFIFSISFTHGSLDWTLTLSHDTHLRGRTMVSKTTADQRAAAQLPKGLPHVMWGGLKIRLQRATNHFLVQGATGSGKTLLIRLLMQSVLPGVGKTDDCRALVYDDKSELYPILRGMVHNEQLKSLSPFDARCYGWNIAQDITGPNSAREVSAILVPETKADHPFFRNAVRLLTQGVMESFIEYSPGLWTLRDVLIALQNRERLKEVLIRSRAGKELYDSLMPEDGGVANANIISSIQVRLSSLHSVAESWHQAALAGRRLSLSEWLDGAFILHLGKVEACREASNTINQVLLNRASQLVLDKGNSSTRRTWFFLDEVREIGKLDMLHSLLNKGRSKGTCVVLGFQDIAGMRAVYGRDIAHEICGECGHKAFLRVDSDEAAEWASRTIGDREFRDTGINTGPQGTSSNEQTRISKVVMSAEINEVAPTTPANGLTGYFLVPSVGDVYRHTFSGEQLSNTLVLPADVPDRIARPKSEEYLTPWNDDDLRRLKLDGPSSATAAEVNPNDDGPEFDLGSLFPRTA